jgi:hypothetical protein
LTSIIGSEYTSPEIPNFFWSTPSIFAENKPNILLLLDEGAFVVAVAAGIIEVIVVVFVILLIAKGVAVTITAIAIIRLATRIILLVFKLS